MIGALRRTGPPVVVVTAEASADAALAMFNAGASDCVTASDDYAEVLPAVALEQIRVWRARSARQAVRQRIRDLRSYLENIIQNMYSGLVVLDDAGCVAVANPMAEQILGVAASGLAGRPIAEWFGAAGARRRLHRTHAAQRRARAGRRRRGAARRRPQRAGRDLVVAAPRPGRNAARRRRQLLRRLGAGAAPDAGAAHGEDGLAGPARGGRRARDQQPDGLRAREPGADGGVPRGRRDSCWRPRARAPSASRRWRASWTPMRCSATSGRRSGSRRRAPSGSATSCRICARSRTATTASGSRPT